MVILGGNQEDMMGTNGGTDKTYMNLKPERKAGVSKALQTGPGA